MPDESNKPKKSLASTDQMREFLKMDQTSPEPPKSFDDPTTAHAGQLPPDLPFMDTLEDPGAQDQMSPPPKAIVEPTKPVSKPATPRSQLLGPATAKGNEAYAFVLWFAKTVVPYIAIFLVGLGLYFFYFSEFSIYDIFDSDRLTLQEVTNGESSKALENLKEDQQDEYLKWMGQFFFSVNDEAIISMDADVSGNGLTNFEKYLLDLNPKVYATRGNGQADGALVIEDINPWTGKPFTEEQKQLVEKYINKELISNRITAAALNRGVTKFAEYVQTDSPYYIAPEALAAAAQNNPTASSPELASNQTAASAAAQAAPSNLNPDTEINTSIPGRLEIPANKVSVPLIWTKNVADFDKDLKSGVVHYPGTAFPGQMGTSYISGHSSGYLWDKSPYKQVFAVLGQVKDGTSFTITATQKNGKQVRYNYVVERRGEFAANDQAQFINTADSVVALSTCWPVGTTAKRLVLFAKLSQTEQL
jgi:sortase A